MLLLGACLPIYTGLQQAASGYAWTSAFVLPLLLLTAPFIRANQYGCQILLGVGVGFVACGLILLVPFAIEERDLCKDYVLSYLRYSLT